MHTRYCLIAAIVCTALLGCNSSNVANKPTASSLQDTRKPLATLDGNVALAFSPDGKWLAVGAELVDVSTWEVVAMLEPRVSDKNPKSKNHWGYTSAAFSPDSSKLALGDQDGTLRILSVPSLEMTHEVLAHGARLTGIGFAADNETIVTSSVDDFIRLRIWNASTDKLIFRSVDSGKFNDDQLGPLADIVGAVDIFALSPNRDVFAVADVMSNIMVISARDGSVLHQFKGPDGDVVEMDSLAFTHDASKLLVGTTPKVHVYNLDGEPTGVVVETQADTTPLSVKTVNDKGLTAILYTDGNTTMPAIELYDMAQQKSLGSFFPHDMRGSFWAVSPNGQYIATTGRGGPVHVWNVAELLGDLAEL